MVTEKRFLIEFYVLDGETISRYVSGQGLTKERAKQWAEKLVEQEDCLLSVNRLEDLYD